MEAQITPANNNITAPKRKSWANAEEMIQASMAQEERVRLELRKKKAMMKDALERDKDYRSASEDVKEAQQARKQVKDELLKTSSLNKLAVEIGMLKEAHKAIQITLSDYLLEYVEKTGLQAIEDHRGTLRQLKVYKQISLF